MAGTLEPAVARLQVASAVLAVWVVTEDEEGLILKVHMSSTAAIIMGLAVLAVTADSAVPGAAVARATVSEAMAALVVRVVTAAVSRAAASARLDRLLDFRRVGPVALAERVEVFTESLSK